jgi:hypothetical protein
VTLLAGQVGGKPGSTQRTQPYVDRLEELAAELARRGLHAKLTTPSGRIPGLHVVNPALPRLAEDVYVGRTQDGSWWYWWPWAERIAPGSETAVAAALIAKVLDAGG